MTATLVVMPGYSLSNQTVSFPAAAHFASRLNCSPSPVDLWDKFNSITKANAAKPAMNFSIEAIMERNRTNNECNSRGSPLITSSALTPGMCVHKLLVQPVDFLVSSTIST